MTAHFTAEPPRIALSTLPPEHYTTVERAISNILSTTLARETYAQIVDGLPVRDVYQEYYGGGRPEYSANLQPSPLALQITDECRETLTLDTVHIDMNVSAPSIYPSSHI